MDILEEMAADIALAMNGGEWKDGKWYSKGHRDAWIKAVKPYANEIERLRNVNKAQAKWLYDEQQAHKALRDKVRQWLRDDKPDILKESE